MLSFGSRDDALNLVEHRFTLGRRQRADAVAAAITGYIRSLPEQENLAQSTTNLIAWLEFTPGFDCDSAKTDDSNDHGGGILVLTDALESSTLVDAKALLEGKTGLPEADVDLKGCTLILYGLGAA